MKQLVLDAYLASCSTSVWRVTIEMFNGGKKVEYCQGNTWLDVYLQYRTVGKIVRELVHT
jgi:hypothetical protein